MRCIAIFRLRFTYELTACRHDFRRARDHIGHLEAEPRPRPLSFAPAVYADHAATNRHLADDLILLQHRAAEDLGVKSHRTRHIRRPDHILESFHIHAPCVAQMLWR